MSLQQILAATWEWNAGVVLLALAVAAVHWRWTRTAGDARYGPLTAALVLLILALGSPLNVLAEGCLFSAHMAQHLLLLVVVPALLLASLPRRAEGPAWSRRRGWALAGWIGGVGAMWFWHVPALCDAASASTAVHGLQALSLLVLGSGFWWPIFAPNTADRIAPWAGVGYLFAACLACTALGILLTLTPLEVCPIFRSPADRFALLPVIRNSWGISAARDRAVGGLLMWVPMCAIYVGAILVELTRWYGAKPLPRSAVAS